MNYKDRYLTFPAACFWSVLLLLSCMGSASAQKYNFINFNVENGLVQSQVTAFAQDRNNELLVGTYGGFSIFDGTNFVNYNKSAGLSQNLINALDYDSKGSIWIGTDNGVSRFNGRQFKTYYPSAANSEDNAILQIETDGYGQTWALTRSRKLFYFTGAAFSRETRIGLVSAITLDKTGNLWAASQQGIYIFKGKDWHREVAITHNNLGVFIKRMSFGRYSGTLYCLSLTGLLAVENGQLETPDWANQFLNKDFTNILEDSKGNIWLSLDDGGAWVGRQQSWTHYTYQNGLTDDLVYAFYEDREGNIWIGTNGSGIYRYTGSIFTYYDRSSGLSGPSIMAIAQGSKGDLFLASGSSGLYRLHESLPGVVPIDSYHTGVNSLLTDSSGRLWIGTDRNGLWYMDAGGRPHRFGPSLGKGIFSVNHLFQSGSTLWIAGSDGLFHLEGRSLVTDTIIRGIVALGAINNDSLLVGTLKGAFIYLTGPRRLVAQPFVSGSTTLCFASDSRNVYIGTDDKGVLVWDRATGAFSVINQKSGLTCDYVYSLLRDRSGNIWVGTGCGIDKIAFTDKGRHIRSFGRSDGLLGVENNANAALEDREGFLWFGTTKGVFRYNPYIPISVQQPPCMVLQSVKLFSKDLPPTEYSDSLIPFTNLQWRPVFPPGKNHITFSFKGICLSNPEKIRYRYQLVGTDKNFTETDQTTVVYPNLPPGEYLFKVWASDAEGHWYPNAIAYPFVIKAPYYTTWYFRLGLGFLLIGLFMGGVYYRNRQKERRRLWEERLREKEQALVRQKTAEDFHDEIGNKLTRINLLATIAENKLLQPPQEIKGILEQIRENVTSLYNGSKDIIWSLQPDSDFLDEIIFRIRQNSAELLQDTGIRFEYEEATGIPLHVKMPIDYSRNLIMIFKEAINNTVKHARASQITLAVTERPAAIVLALKDNGKGFDTAQTGKGNGLGNMTNRARRIGVQLELSSTPGGGTTLSLSIPLPA
ncbi:ligand-binding sensor domain-containing protein [Taibaiella koreensis]|uniref:ligand-binding sensor domain-containing protein n=1 Tax=Taibaiella koreensis TaxID=1268548 RepID=UPI0013C2DAED|nr:sensor histidine kinase [Taibaiella koreensis]